MGQHLGRDQLHMVEIRQVHHLGVHPFGPSPASSPIFSTTSAAVPASPLSRSVPGSEPIAAATGRSISAHAHGLGSRQDERALRGLRRPPNLVEGRARLGQRGWAMPGCGASWWRVWPVCRLSRCRRRGVHAMATPCWEQLVNATHCVSVPGRRRAGPGHPPGRRCVCRTRSQVITRGCWTTPVSSGGHRPDARPAGGGHPRPSPGSLREVSVARLPRIPGALKVLV